MVRPYGRSRSRSTTGLTRLQRLRHLRMLRERLNRSVEHNLLLPNSATEQRQEPAERLVRTTARRRHSQSGIIFT